MAQPVLRIDDIEHLHWKFSESDSPSPLTANSDLSLAAAVELACIESHHSQQVLNRSSSIWKLLRASKWPNAQRQIKITNGPFSVVLFAKGDFDIWWTDRLRELVIELHNSGFSLNLSRAIAGGIAEMVDNVSLHSEAPTSGILVYQIARRKFAFSVADTGVGVMHSLRKNPKYRWIGSSMEAIRHAIRPGVSRTNDGGLGFASLMLSFAELWGTTRIRSGEASLVIDRTTEKRRMEYLYLPHLPGVHVSVRCAIDPPKK